jgi:uncharacterized heparinase superfamily protein
VSHRGFADSPGARFVRGVLRIPVVLRTVRKLPVRQLLYLVVRRVQQKLPARLTAPPPGAVSARESALAETATIVVAHAGSGSRAEAVLRREFLFVGTSRRLDPIDWGKEYVNPLWTFNLHYFDYGRDLALAFRETSDDRYVESFKDLVSDWISSCKPPSAGWQPYPTSLRIVNWVYSLLLLGDSLPADFRASIARSVMIQAAWLERRLEHHLGANHLQVNYKALAIAGLFFEGRSARRWRKRGFSGTWRAVATQVLRDGVHYERSPMYHAIALGDFLELLALADAVGETVPEEARTRVRDMVRAFGILSRTDGTLHLFNDSANGIAPARADLARMAKAVLGEDVGVPVARVALREAGYWGWVDQEQGIRLVLDCGEPGPKHQPAHAHCDLLSFELDLGGQPVVVDSGVSGYAGDPLRDYVRSTRAHNTVQVGRREQSEMWGVFRMGRAARVTCARPGQQGIFRFTGAYELHDGSAAHERMFDWDGQRLRIEDRVVVAKSDCVRSFIHLHPDLTVEREANYLRVIGNGRHITIQVGGADRIHVGRGAKAGLEGWYCPRFGTVLAAPVIALESSRSISHTLWYEIALEDA